MPGLTGRRADRIPWSRKGIKMLTMSVVGAFYLVAGVAFLLSAVVMVGR